MNLHHIFVFLLTVGALMSCDKPGARPAAQNIVQAKASDAEVVVGMIDAFSGARAEFGNSARSGMLLALDEWQQSHRLIQGRKLRVEFFDDAAELKKSEEGFQSLTKNFRLAALVGPSSSSRSLVVGALAQQAEIPMITPAATHPDVTLDKDYVFRACFIDTLQGQMMAQFVRKRLGFSSVAMLVDDDLAYSQHLAKVFAETFTKLGGKIVSTQTYRGNEAIHFETQLRAIQAKRPEALYVPGLYSNIYHIASQARSLGLRQPFLGGDGWDSEKLFEQAKGFLDGTYFSNHFTLQSAEPSFLKFRAAFEKKYKRAPNAFAALAYDASLMLFEAMSRAASLKGSDIRDQLASTEKFPGATGPISLDSSRNAVKPVSILRIHKGRPELVTTYAP